MKASKNSMAAKDLIEPGSNILYMYLFYSLVYNSADSHCKEYC